MMRLLGLFKWYDTQKGFGVISTLLPKVKETQEIFFHHSCWSGKIPTKIIGVPVSFMVRKREFKGGYEAWSCSIFDSSVELWQYLFDNKEYNLVVNTNNGNFNMLELCVSMINTPQDANNFIQVFNQWQSEHPINSCYDILECLNGGKDVKVQGFYYYIQDVTSSIPFEERKELFEKRQIGLNCFSDSETLHIIDLIDKSQYVIIKDVRTDLYVKIVRERILKAVAVIDFSNYSTVKQDSFATLLEEFYSLSSAEAIQKLQNEVNSIILSKEDEFVIRVNEIIESPIDIVAYHFRDLLSFPELFSRETISHLEGTAYRIIKEKGIFKNNIELMSQGVLPADISYVEKNTQSFDKDTIQTIVEAISSFSSEEVSRLLFDYLDETGDIDTTIYLYNKRLDIQKDELTEVIKNSVNDNCLKPEVSFVSKATDYINLLGEDYVFSITEKYLISTHSSEAVLEQLSLADDKYKERLSQLLFSYKIDYRDNIDELFVEPFCGSIRKGIHPLFSEDFIVDIVEAYSQNRRDFKQALSYAETYSPEVKARFEDYLFATLTREEYMLLWKEERCDKLPEGYFDSFFDDDEDKYKLVEKWMNKRLPEGLVSTSMLITLDRIRNIPYYRHFRTEFHIFEFFTRHHWDNLIESAFSSSKVSLFKWAIEPSFCDYDSICGSFILFPEIIQVKLLKFIFLSMAQGVFKITASDLYKLYDCYPEYMYYSDDDKPAMSLSVSVIIEALYSYEKNGEFHIGQKDLLRHVFNYAQHGFNSITPIGEFFDKCTGKKSRKYPSSNSIEKFIFPIIDKNKNRFYIINFNYDPHLVERIKKCIPWRKYNKENKFWYAPDSSYAEIELFARENQFLLLNKNMPLSVIGKPFESIVPHITDKEYFNAAWHLSYLYDCKENNNYKISFCEGENSQNSDQQYVWWCVGHSPCHACAIKTHLNDEWQNYTLYDFCNILGFDLVEINKYGQFKTGGYNKLITLINRFNDLLERLYCRECGTLLYPTEINYSVYGATLFKCTKPNCPQYGIPIYLNRCYTNKCRGIIDSRDGAKCPNGLVICSTCGTCCTTAMYRQRLQRLMDTGSHFIPERLVYLANNDGGHINHESINKKDEFFCHKCGAKLDGDPTNTVCPRCGTIIRYQTDLIYKKYY